MEEGVTGHLRLNTVVGTQEISESESEDAKLVVDQHRGGKAGLTEEDMADCWMKGEVGDSKKVDAGVAYNLADSLDQRLGFPTVPRASSAASTISGDKDSDTPSKRESAAPSANTPSKQEELDALKWKRDKTKKTAAAKAVMNEEVKKVEIELEELKAVIAKARKDVLFVVWDFLLV